MFNMVGQFFLCINLSPSDEFTHAKFVHALFSSSVTLILLITYSENIIQEDKGCNYRTLWCFFFRKLPRQNYFS